MKTYWVRFKKWLVSIIANWFDLIPLEEADKVLKHFGVNIKTLHLEDRTEIFQMWKLISLGKFDRSFKTIVITESGNELVKASEYLRRMAQYRIAYNMSLKELAEEFRQGEIGFTEYLQFLMGRESWVIQFANDLQWAMLTLIKGHIQKKHTLKKLDLGMGDSKWIWPSYPDGVDFNQLFNYVYSGAMEMEIYGHKENKMTEQYLKELKSYCQQHNFFIDSNLPDESNGK